MAGRDSAVLIVGAGPSGLALATELTFRGQHVHVIERNARTGVQPRAKTTNVRTMTQMRRWGLAEEVRKRSPLPKEFPRRVVFQTSLFSTPIHSFDDAFCASPRRADEFPEHAEFIPQYVIENILADHVAAHPLATLRFGKELLDFIETEDGIVATIKDAQGNIERVKARYLVGADGGRSTVRERLGIGMQGVRNIQSFVTLILKIPGLIDDPDLPRALFHWIVKPDAACILGPMDQGDLWYYARVARSDVATDDLLGILKQAIGRDFAIDVAARDNWVVHSLIADRYRVGKAFLVGDACHLHSPFGGHGMNLGIGDAVDLGWKLASALEGWGSDALLDSYDIERREVHQDVVASATRNVAVLSEQFASDTLLEAGTDGDTARENAAAEIEERKGPEFRSLGLVLGYRYKSSPMIAPEQGDGPPLEVTAYAPTARPGHLAPHAWLDEGTSIYDCFSKGFTIVSFSPANSDVQALLEGAEAAGIPVEHIALADERLRELYGKDFVLVRPDQHVAWRGNQIPGIGMLIDLMRGASGAETLGTAGLART